MEQNIILKKEFLNPNIDISQYPDLLYQRIEQYNKLQQIITGAWIRYVRGKPGTGKTQHVKSLLKELRGVVIYINCSVYRRKSDLYKHIFFELYSYFPEMKNYEGRYGNDFIGIYETLTKNNSTPVYLILDEVDKILYSESGENPNLIIHQFCRLTSESPNFTFRFIFIANKKIPFEDEIDQMIRTSNVMFGIYNTNELFEIVKLRAKASLTPETYTNEQLFYIAEFISKEYDGNSRDAILLLDMVASNSSERMVDPTTFFKRFHDNKLFEDIPNMSIDCKVLLKAIVVSCLGQFTQDMAYQAYYLLSHKEYPETKPRTPRQVHTYFTDMIEVGILSITLETVTKRPKYFTLDVDREALLRYLSTII